MVVTYILILIIGILIGVKIRSHIGHDEKVIGVVQIDHETGFCRFLITKDQLSNPNCKIALFKVEHNAIITDDDSQEKHVL